LFLQWRFFVDFPLMNTTAVTGRLGDVDRSRSMVGLTVGTHGAEHGTLSSGNRRKEI